MSLDDIDAVAAIEQLTFPRPMPVRALRHELTDNKNSYHQVVTMMTAGGAEQVSGYLGYWLLAGEAHISTIAVHPERQGQGLGELLLLNMLFLIYPQGASLATLEVRRSNLVAQRLYHKYRFEIVGERRRYYRDNGEDALLMTVGQLDWAYYRFLETQREALLLRLASEV